MVRTAAHTAARASRTGLFRRYFWKSRQRGSVTDMEDMFAWVPRLIYMFNSAYEAIVCFLWGCAQRWQGACLSEQLARSLSLAAFHASSGGLS